MIDVIGAWLGIFLTICILSFLYKDNPFYKFAEHLFVGVSIGYVVTQQLYNVLVPKLGEIGHAWWRIFPLILVALMFVKAVSRRWAWLGRYPLAFVVAFYAGLQINAVVTSELGAQISFASKTLDAEKIDLNTASVKELGKVPGVTPRIAHELVAARARTPFTSVDDAVTRGTLSKTEREDLSDKRGDFVGIDARASARPHDKDWFGIVSNVLLLMGLLSSLLYFYSSLAHKGIVGKVSRFGIWVLMIGFGASFGFTVQGRIALAIGRALDLKGATSSVEDAAQIHGPWAALVSVVIVIAGIAIWELRQRRPTGGPPAAGASPAAETD